MPKKIWLVHNGIIENYQELKNQLEKKGHKFYSETDTEVIAHLVEELEKKSDYETAFKKALTKLEGTYGLASFHQDYPNQLFVAKKGSPLLLGLGKNEYIVASDASAVVNHTNQVIYLEDGEIAKIYQEDGEMIHKISDLENQEVKKNIKKIDWSEKEIEKGKFGHFMEKEIFEQPEAIENSLRGRTKQFKDANVQPVLGGLKKVEARLRKIEKIVIVSCGTSYYAGLTGEYMLEEYAEIPTEVEIASEFRYRTPLLDKKTAVLAISQSGETADTLEAIREAKTKGALTLGIVNTVGSSIARETDAGIYNHAGPEIAVASTKAFTTQLVVLALLTLMLGRQRRMSFVTAKKIAEELEKIPSQIKTILKEKNNIKKIAEKYLKYEDWFFLGRKYSYPVALEGALKLKEISYAHAEGYPAGEMKHGPIAMIDKNFPSFFIAPKDSVFEKTKSAMEEIKARNGKIVAITAKGNKKLEKVTDDIILIPKTSEMTSPFLTVIPTQLFAFYIATKRGLDVDKPRNLAKSVTVE